jgi:DNA-directed RNA polymerase specialized sigma subunit
MIQINTDGRAEEFDTEFAELVKIFAAERSRQEPTEQELRAARRETQQYENLVRRAASQLVVDHMGFIYSRIEHLLDIEGVVRDDLIDAATEGFLKAIPLHDPARGATLATFARGQIRDSVANYLLSVGLVRVPSHIDKLVPRIRRIEEREKNDGHPHPTDALIASELDVKPEFVTAARNRPTVVALDDDLHGAASLSVYTQSSEELAELSELACILPRVIADLPPRAQNLMGVLLDEGGDERAIAAAGALVGMRELTARTHRTRIQQRLLADPRLDGWVGVDSVRNLS